MALGILGVLALALCARVAWQFRFVGRLVAEVDEAVKVHEAECRKPEHDVTASLERLRRLADRLQGSRKGTGRARSRLLVAEGRARLEARQASLALQALEEAGRRGAKSSEWAFLLLWARSSVALSAREDLRGTRLEIEGEWAGIFASNHAPAIRDALAKAAGAAPRELLEAFRAWVEGRLEDAADLAGRVSAAEPAWPLAQRLRTAALTALAEAGLASEEGRTNGIRALEAAERTLQDLVAKRPSDPSTRVGICLLAASALRADLAVGRIAWPRLEPPCTALKTLLPGDAVAFFAPTEARALAVDEDVPGALEAQRPIVEAARKVVELAPQSLRARLLLGKTLAVRARLLGRETDEDVRPVAAEAAAALDHARVIGPKASLALAESVTLELDVAIWSYERGIPIVHAGTRASSAASKLQEMELTAPGVELAQAAFGILYGIERLRMMDSPAVFSGTVSALQGLEAEGIEEARWLRRVVELETSRWEWCRKTTREPDASLDLSAGWGAGRPEEGYLVASAREQAARIALAKGFDANIAVNHIAGARLALVGFPVTGADDRRDAAELARKLDQLEIRAALLRGSAGAELQGLADRARASCVLDMASPLTRFHARFSCAGTELLLADAALRRGRVAEAQALLEPLGTLVADAVRSAHGGTEGKVLDLAYRMMQFEAGPSSPASDAALSRAGREAADAVGHPPDERLLVVAERLARLEREREISAFAKRPAAADPRDEEGARTSHRFRLGDLDSRLERVAGLARQQGDCTRRMFP